MSEPCFKIKSSDTECKSAGKFMERPKGQVPYGSLDLKTHDDDDDDVFSDWQVHGNHYSMAVK